MILEVVFDSDGCAKFVHDDRLAELARPLGVPETRRASDVEPVMIGGRTMWTADLRRVGGPVLGPFRMRALALEREALWLRRHGMPFPGGA